MATKPKPTHMVLQLVTCVSVGQLKPGAEINKKDVTAAEWQYLEAGGLIKSLAEIQKEADEADKESEDKKPEDKK